MFERTKRTRVIVSATVLAAFFLALVRPAWLSSSSASSRKDEPAGKEKPGGFSFTFGAAGAPVDVQAPTRGRIAEVVHAPAAIKSGGEVAVGAPFEGKIVELCLDEGAQVKANDVIFKLDPIEWDDKVQEAELELARRKAALLEAEAEMREAEHKVEETQKEAAAVTDARLRIRVSELSAEKARAQLDNAGAKLARAKEMLSQNVGKKEDVEAAEAEQRVEEISLSTTDKELGIAKEVLAAKLREAEDGKVSSAKALDSAKTHCDRSKADVTAGQVALDRARRDRARCEVRSPIDGVITQRNVNWGSLVGRGDGRTADTTHYIVSDMAHMYAYADVDEGDVVKVREGQPVRVRVNALGDDLRLTGKVVDVANRAQKVSNEETKSFRVRILISPKDERLRPDMSSNVDIETRTSADDAIRLPSQATVQRAKKDLPEGVLAKATWLSANGSAGANANGAAGSQRSDDKVDCIFVCEGDKAVVRAVQLGVSDGDHVEVKQGLDANDQVVIGPYRALENLKNGDALRPTKKEHSAADVATASSSTAASEKSVVRVEVKGGK
ncbi:efflux RND transporter periplasmic adaptor subunit [bacterium]|nr:efflux RND transporter periplasmic adaptor subunit [bacterium]